MRACSSTLAGQTVHVLHCSAVAHSFVLPLLLSCYHVGILLQAAAAVTETAAQADTADVEEEVLPQLALSCYYTAAGTRVQVHYNTFA
jgi:hypothetical protein